jgi:hypothetical protein
MCSAYFLVFTEGSQQRDRSGGNTMESGESADSDARNVGQNANFRYLYQSSR